MKKISSLRTTNYVLCSSSGFTLIETLVAVSILTMAIVAPMTLVSKSLSAAYYARDQIAAFHLAQEAIETVRHIRDHNILVTALDTPTDILAGIPVGQRFIVDTRNDRIWDETNWSTCLGGEVPPLKTDGTFHGHGDFPCEPNEPGWTPTRFTRYVEAIAVASDENNIPQEIRISVTVTWRASSLQLRSITISENLYRWVEDGSGAQP